MIAANSGASVRLFRSDLAISDRDGPGRPLALAALVASLTVHWIVMSTSETGSSLTLGATTALKTSIQIAAPSSSVAAPAEPTDSPPPDRTEVMQTEPMPQPMAATVPIASPKLSPIQITEPLPLAATVPIAPPKLEPVRITETRPSTPPFQPQAKPTEPPRPEPLAESSPREATPAVKPVEQTTPDSPAPSSESAPPDTVRETAAASTSDPAPIPTQQAAAVSGGTPTAEPVLVTEPRFRAPPTPPAYPPVARRRNEEGTVVLRALVSPGGNTQRIEIWQSSGFYRLDDAARAAVEDWRFEPARRAGMAVASWVQVPIRFRLD